MSFSVPALITLINNTVSNNPNWTYLERYIKINNIKLKERFPLNKQIPGKANAYVNGIVIEKTSNHILFITYTLHENEIVLNHKSTHGPNGELLSLYINAFYLGFLNGVDEDGEEYVSEYVNICLNNDDFKWDIIQ